jgi:hypothetical protein
MAENDAAMFRELAGELADQYELPRDFIQAVFEKESSYRPDAESPAGAIGIAQLMPDTAKRMGVDPTKPVQAMEAGVKILKENYDRFGGDLVKTYAGYNSNPDKVEERMARGFTGLPEETQKAIEWLTERVPSMLETPGAPRAQAAESAMPLMSDALDPVDRTPRDKAVNIPSANAMVYSQMGRERDQQPWYQRLPETLLDPLAELGITGARAATGSTIPPPPMDRLATDALQAATLMPGMSLGRLGSAALFGGAGAAAGMQQAAERHQTTGDPIVDQVNVMDTYDAVQLGLQTIVGGLAGGAFPTKAPRALSPAGAIARGRDDLQTMMARETAEMAAPPARSAEVAAAFGQINRNQPIDATPWFSKLIDWAGKGRSVPAEVSAIADKLQPGLNGYQVGTTLGDLLDANMALGSMVNTKEGRLAAQAVGHNLDNLTALRGTLSDAIESALPTGRDLMLYRTARETSKEVAQHNAGMRIVEKYLNPTEGVANGAGLFEYLTGANRERILKTVGSANYAHLKDFASSIKGVTKESGNWLAQALKPLVQPSLFNAAVGGGSFYLGGPAGAAAVGGGRALYALATSRPMRMLVDEAARYAPRSGRAMTSQGLAAIGRLTAAAEGLAQKDKPADPGSLDGLLMAGQQPPPSLGPGMPQ